MEWNGTRWLALSRSRHQHTGDLRAGLAVAVEFPKPWCRRHPQPERSQGGVREAAIAQPPGRILAVLVRTSGRRLLSLRRSNRFAKSPSASIRKILTENWKFQTGQFWHWRAVSSRDTFR